MALKEKPLIDAAGEAGPVPGFIYANSFTSGVFAILCCVIFGVIGGFFFGAYGAGQYPVEYFDAMRVGVFFALIIGAFALVAFYVSCLGAPEEAASASAFLAGGVAALALIFAVDFQFSGMLRDWLAKKGSIVSEDLPF